MTRNFEEWLSTFRPCIADYCYYVDFDKVNRNVDSLKVELNILNTLVGSKNIEKDFEDIITKYPETLKCIPLLLAVRANEISVTDADGEYNFSFKKCNYSIDDYKMFMRKTKLFDLLENHIVSNLVDYVTGVETGLDTNARKNRSGHLMEGQVASMLDNAGVACRQEVYSTEYPELSVLGEDKKRFDFVVESNHCKYLMEVNFYSGGGSKLNEVARAYSELSPKINAVDGFEFVWITDGIGWKSAKNKLEEAFYAIPNIYNLTTIDEFIKQVKEEL